MRSSTLITAPTGQLFTLDEAKRHLRVDDAVDDARINNLITSARRWVEDYTRRATLNATWQLYLDFFPAVIELPFPPLASVTAASFTYVDGDGNSTQVPTATYTVDADAEAGRIYEAYEQTWPTPRVVEKAITVEFVAGYGTAATDVPPAMIEAAYLWLENQFDHAGTSNTLRDAAQSLLDPYAVHYF